MMEFVRNEIRHSRLLRGSNNTTAHENDPEMQGLIANEEAIDMHASFSTVSTSSTASGGGTNEGVTSPSSSTGYGNRMASDANNLGRNIEEGRRSEQPTVINGSTPDSKRRHLKRQDSFLTGHMFYDTATEENMKCIASSAIFIAVVVFFIVAAFFWNPEM